MTVQSLRRLASLGFLTSLLSGLVLLTAPAAQASPFAYISNYGISGSGNTVSVIDTATNTVTATVTVGNRPYGVAVTPDGAQVYVANQFSDTVSVIRTATNTVIATVAVGSKPFGVAVTPDGARVYVANFFSASVSVIGTATNTVIATVAVGGGINPSGVAVTPDGARVYVTNGNGLSNAIPVISTATNTLIANVAVSPSITGGLAVTPDGARVYVADESNNAVRVISTATNTVIATVGVGAGFTPFGVAVTPDGTQVYVTNFNGSNVSVISTATNTVTATVAVGSLPAGVAVTPDGAWVYVTNSNSANVSVISTATNTVAATVPVGVGPRGLGLFITACATPPSGMVAWYRLNELVGATAINDIAPPPGSIFNNVGTPKPGPVSQIGPPTAGPAPVPGKVGSALYFYDPYVEVAPNSELDFSMGDFTVDAGVTAFSIDAWVRIVTVGPALIQPVVDKFSSPGGPGFAFYIRNRLLELNLNGSTFVSTGPPMAFANPIANTGPWYHVAVTVQGGGRFGQGFFYINGALAGTFQPSSGTANNNLPMWIGKTRVSGPPGELAIDELELFNRALSQSEIQAIFNAGSAGKCIQNGLKPVVEFYNDRLDNFFITADPDEQTAVNNGAAGPGWFVTGDTFSAGGAVQVCRFYGSLSPGPNSHFYTIDPAECQGLKDLQATTPVTQKRWNFESNDFSSSMPANGQCGSGMVPVYRAYNNGFTRGVDSNHRITANQTSYQSQLAKGWIGEGVVMCAPAN